MSSSSFQPDVYNSRFDAIGLKNQLDIVNRSLSPTSLQETLTSRTYLAVSDSGFYQIHLIQKIVYEILGILGFGNVSDPVLINYELLKLAHYGELNNFLDPAILKLIESVAKKTDKRYDIQVAIEEIRGNKAFYYKNGSSSAAVRDLREALINHQRWYQSSLEKSLGIKPTARFQGKAADFGISQIPIAKALVDRFPKNAAVRVIKAVKLGFIENGSSTTQTNQRKQAVFELCAKIARNLPLDFSYDGYSLQNVLEELCDKKDGMSLYPIQLGDALLEGDFRNLERAAFYALMGLKQGLGNTEHVVDIYQILCEACRLSEKPLAHIEYEGLSVAKALELAIYRLPHDSMSTYDLEVALENASKTKTVIPSSYVEATAETPDEDENDFMYAAENRLLDTNPYTTSDDCCPSTEFRYGLATPGHSGYNSDAEED